MFVLGLELLKNVLDGSHHIFDMHNRVLTRYSVVSKTITREAPVKKISLLVGLLLLPVIGSAEDNAPTDTIVVEGKYARPDRPEMRPKVPEYSLQTQRFDFPTGLRIYMQADPTHPIASIFTVVDHGHSDDAEGAEGSAHFCEHLWFRSSHDTFGEEFNGVPVMSILNDMGAQMNATTRADWTDYRTVASKEFLPLMLKMGRPV